MKRTAGKIRWMHNGISLAHAFAVGRSGLPVRVSLCGRLGDSSMFATWRDIHGKYVIDNADNPRKVCGVCMTEVRDRGAK